MKTPSTCHPDRPVHLKGLCRSCYFRDWHERHPGRQAAYGRQFRAANPEAAHGYYLKVKDRVAVLGKARRDANPTINQRRVAAKYGLTVEERAALLARPCEICGGIATDIDHDHETGRVRGALCGECNSGIGRLKDDPELVARAAEYLAARRPLLRIA